MEQHVVWEQVAQNLSRFEEPAAVRGGGAAEPALAYSARPAGQAWSELRAAAMGGAPWSVFEAVKSCMHWSDASLARFLRVSEKTLQRARMAGKDLGADAAEKALDFAGLLVQGLETFGEGQRFLSWLRTPAPWFDGDVPENFVFDRFGRELVREAVGRIEHGIWS